MATDPNKNRLGPPLFHVFRAAHRARDAKKSIDLRDGDGERVLAARRATGRIAISEPILRREVSTDVENLMNTISLESSFDLADCAFVKESILNYGIPDITHRSIDESGVDHIVGELQTALRTFEPRLVPESIKVERDMSLDDADLKVRFVIHADLRCDPLAVPITFVADVQTDTGTFFISQR